MSDYRVGKGRPPRNWQFKPGQSGNPGGRPRKKQGVDVIGLLDEPVAVSQDGRTRSLPPAEVMLRRIVKRALKDDDLRSILFLIEQFHHHEVFAPPASTGYGGVLPLPNSMPWAMALDLAERFGLPPWNEKQKALGRERYLATRTEEERVVDEAMEYPDL